MHSRMLFEENHFHSSIYPSHLLSIHLIICLFICRPKKYQLLCSLNGDGGYPVNEIIFPVSVELFKNDNVSL